MPAKINTGQPGAYGGNSLNKGLNYFYGSRFSEDCYLSKDRDSGEYPLVNSIQERIFLLKERAEVMHLVSRMPPIGGNEETTYLLFVDRTQ